MHQHGHRHHPHQQHALRQHHHRRVQRDRRQPAHQKNHIRDPLHRDQNAHQAHAQIKHGHAVAVLHCVAHLMRGNRDGGDRPPVEMRLAKPHHAVHRVVVISLVRQLDRHLVQPGLIEQVARQLAAGTGEVGAVRTVPRHGPAHIEHRPEDQQQQPQAERNVRQG